MENLKVNHNEIVDKIYAQFYQVKNNNEKYDKIVFFVDDEQTFIKRGDAINSRAIYIVLKFGEATFNKVSSVIPLTFLVFGVGNDIELTKDFLTDYTTMFNLSRDGDIQFIFSSPYVLSNFNELGYDFRAMFTISSSLVIGSGNSIYVDYIEYENEKGEKEKLEFIDFTDDTTNMLNPQIYGDNLGRSKSYGTSQSYLFSLSFYSVNNLLIRDVMTHRFSMEESSANKDYIFSISFIGGFGFSKWKFKLKNVNFTSKLGQIPVISIAFTL